MGHLASWKHHSMRLSSVFWRFLTNGESTSVRRSTSGNWDLKVSRKDPLSVHFDLTGGRQEQQAGFRYRDAIGALEETCAVRLDNSQSAVEHVSRKYDKAWRKQNDSSLGFSVVLPGTNPVHLLMQDQPLSRFSRHIHSNSFDFQAENYMSQVDTITPRSIYESALADKYLPCHQVVKYILSRKDWERALEELNFQLNTQNVSEIIRRHPNVNAAFLFFQWAKEQQGFQHTGRTYRAILQKLMSHQDFKSRNLDTFQLIMNESLQNGWSPGVTIHTYLVDGYCKIGKVDAAIDHFNEMKLHGSFPNVVTYSSLIGGLIKAGRIDDSLKFLDEMVEMKCHPNVVTYSVLINGLVKHHRLDDACKLFDTMKKQGCTPNLITYSCLIDGVSRAGRFEAVSKLLNQMRETQCIPNIFIYGTLINYFVKTGKLHQAWDLFTEMKQHGLEPNLFVYTPLIASLGKAGNWEHAKNLLAEMKSRRCSPDVVTYSALIGGLVRSGKLEECNLVLDHMEANGCRPNEVTYTVLIDGLVKARQGDKAHALFKKMVASGCTPTMYTQDSLKKVLDKISAQ